ncbi:sensor histidine kinase YesM [Chitinophaga dinghuensis]|uniref:Sensor histidine kinase YesM n=1 Tax=Chitinophaga dinghuensis TaxID=1539050 RepID=A0A327WD29_9BACT|nr:sensor histidine kinase [Chitinophaga dinghuensis]RAJ88149.1 sensor histidine kinase YesM [Chitinophaga dinghuensis]
MIRLKSSVVLAHLTGWLLLISLPLLFIGGQTDSNRALAILFSPEFFVFVITYSALFYFHTNFLFPQLFFKKQYPLYFLSIILLLLMVNLMQPFDHLFMRFPHPLPMHPPGGRPMPPGFPPGQVRMRFHPDYISLFLFILTVALSVAIETTHRWRQTEKRALYAETRKTQAELSFLKAQINPHFLFNTLNNIYSLAITHNEFAAPSIMKLSNMLRYVTEENKNYVLLQGEIGCLTDYIDLQRLRLSKQTKVQFTINGDPGVKCIAPLVLLPFVENAFKFGVSNHDPSEIQIQLDIAADQVHFQCTNRVFRSLQQENRTGIGIANTKQRLEHLYPERYQLSTENLNGNFVVSLILQGLYGDKIHSDR